jgi:hypothetical protein
MADFRSFPSTIGTLRRRPHECLLTIAARPENFRKQNSNPIWYCTCTSLKTSRSFLTKINRFTVGGPAAL